jgi:hypothetical protein
MPPLSNSKFFKIRSHCANLFAHSTAHSVVQLRHPVKRWQYGLSTTASTMQCFPDIQARYSSRWWGWISQSQCCVCSCRARSTVGETTPLDDNLNTSTPHAYRGTQVNDNTKKTVNIALRLAAVLIPPTPLSWRAASAPSSIATASGNSHSPGVCHGHLDSQIVHC